MSFDELPSRVATIWGTRTLSVRKIREDAEHEVNSTDGRSTRVDGVGDNTEIIDLQDGEDIRLRAASMARKRHLMKRYHDRHKIAKRKGLKVTDFKNISKSCMKEVQSSFLVKVNLIERILKKIEGIQIVTCRRVRNIQCNPSSLIPGKFGFTILSYFHFVLWLCCINLLLSIPILLFLIIPQSALPPFSFLDQPFCAEETLTVVDNYTREACDMTRVYLGETPAPNGGVGQLVVDFLQGTGWMERTLMFYGSYFNKQTPHYNMALAFLLTFGAYFLIFLLLIVAYSANNIKQRMLTYKRVTNLSPSHVPSLPLADKLFCGWDFAITDQSQASYCHKSITNQLNEALHEMMKHRNRRPLAMMEILKLWGVRAAINILILLLLLLSLSGIVASIVTQPSLLAHDGVKDDSALKLVCSFLPPISVAFFNFVMPKIFAALTRFEKYSPETCINLMLLRSVLINLASVVTLVVTIGIQLVCGHKQPCIDNVSCWETYVGQQLYKLSLVDFVVDVLTALVDLCRRKLSERFPENKFLRRVGVRSFDVPKNIINVVYKQAVCWLGIFVAPMLSFITTIKFFLLFALKSFTVLVNYKPRSSGHQRSFESKYFFAVVLLFTLVVCSAMNAFAVGRLLPSQSCGPFRVHNRNWHYMYLSAVDILATMPNQIQTFVWFLGTWVFFIIVMVTLSLLFLYYASLVRGNKEFAENLEVQLVTMKSLNQQYRKEILALRQRKGKPKQQKNG